MHGTTPLWAVAAIAALAALLKFAIDDKARWWRLLIILVTQTITVGAVWWFVVSGPGLRHSPTVVTASTSQRMFPSAHSHLQ